MIAAFAQHCALAVFQRSSVNSAWVGWCRPSSCDLGHRATRAALGSNLSELSRKPPERRVGFALLGGIVWLQASIKPLNFQPIFFATAYGRLFGVHHFPEESRANEQAILIMPPMGQDYVRCHKTLQKLATDLAGIGFHVLRFDYTGTGDSSDLEDWDLDTWKRNGLDALRVLSERSKTHRLSIVGVRLGASLALGLDTTLDSLVLWDPVTRGSDYLGELEVLHAELLETTLHSLRANRRSNEVTDELVGHKCTESMRESLQSFSLEADLNVRPSRVLWVESGDAPRAEIPLPVLDELVDAARRHHRLDMNCNWTSPSEVGNTLMGQPAIRVILEFFGKRNRHEGRSA